MVEMFANYFHVEVEVEFHPVIELTVSDIREQGTVRFPAWRHSLGS
jgi:hypothetical protein